MKKYMHAHIFQHLSFEGPGTIQPWLINAGYEITFTVFSEKAYFPAIDTVDFLVVMGGSMSVNDEDKFPWLSSEKQYIRDLIATGNPVLGICLGAQLIASSLGAKVYQNIEKEIGWFPVKGLQTTPANFQFPISFPALHWHGETFDLPEGAVLLASSEACKNQAFQYGKNVLAIQFHPEVNREILENFCFHFKNELVPGKFIQTEDEIFSFIPGKFPELHGIMHNVLSFLTRL
jgi:GMP synthase-like glutamine amidotransferase